MRAAVAILGITALTGLIALAGFVWLPVNAPTLDLEPIAPEEDGADPGGILFRSGARGPDRPLGALMRARQHRDDMLRYQAELAAASLQPTGIDSNSWKLLGPPIAGRLRSILIHPVQPNNMVVGAATGGVWRTLDGGQFWTPSDDFMASLTIGCMAMDPVTPSTVYAGTGEGFFDAMQGSSNTAVIQGEGIFKSTDFGEHWTLLASTASNNDFRFVNRIAVAGTAGNVLLAATATGIFRSINSGASWTKTFDGRVFDVKFHPTDSQRVVAAEAHGTPLYSSDNGATWQMAVGGIVPHENGRTELAWARSVPGKVYAASHDDPDGLYVSVSVDFGANYVRVTNQPDLDSFGDYAKTLWVDPTNDSRLLMGATYLYKSTDGGVTFSELQAGHADHHVLIEHPAYGSAVNRVVFNGNDGGIYKYDDPFSAAPTITDLNSSLVTTQFYGADIHPSGAIVGGTQDNGTWAFDPQTQQWSTAGGGDGSFSAIRRQNPNVIFFQQQLLEAYRSNSGGVGVDTLIFDPPMGEGRNFAAPLVLDPNPNVDRLYLGGRRLWRTSDPLSLVPQWTDIKAAIPNCPPPPFGSDAPPSHQRDNSPCNVSTIAIAPQNSARIWVGYNNGEVWSTTNGDLNMPRWTRQDENGLGLPDRWCSDIVVDPHNQDRAYVSFMGYTNDGVWKTEDFGSTWTKIPGNGMTALPDLPVNGLAVHPIQAGWLYAATDLGIYSSKDDGATWSADNVGPSNVSVDELVFKDNKALMAVTHGRGLWITDTFDDCNGNMIPDFTDIVSGFSQDNNLNTVPDECETGPPPGTAPPITLDVDAGEVLIHCSGSCSSGVSYGIYEGTIGSWYSHHAVAGICQATCPGVNRVTPSVAAAYYLVVPHNQFAEGSYGTARDTTQVRNERPRAPLATQRCAAFQMIAACP